MRVLWMYIGPYNSCDHKDVMTEGERQKHLFANADELWREVGIIERVKLIAKYQQNTEELKDAIVKLG